MRRIALIANRSHKMTLVLIACCITGLTISRPIIRALRAA